MMQLDDLDRKATSAFEGYVVRKDLVRTFSRQFPVPTYVVEFLLGRYCATTDEAEIQEGLDIVQRQLGSRTVKAGEEELFKATSTRVRLGENHRHRHGALDSKTDSYVASLPSLRLNDVRLTRDGEGQRAHADRWLLRRGDAGLRRLHRTGEKGGVPSVWMHCGPFSSPSGRCWKSLRKGASSFTTAEWRDLLLRSVGFEPET
jgi:ATP-dependent Lon protease